MMLDQDACYRALRTRDRRWDGKFFTAVKSTGIYCRPVCPARTPKREHCLFLPSAAAAQRLGFRPCLRCRPELAPPHGGYAGENEVVARALRLLADGFLAEGGTEALAAKLGVSARHLRRLFATHLGASPIAVGQTQRVLFAKQLLTESELSLTDVAFAAGFGSVRRFNAAMRQAFGRTPSELRRSAGRGRTEADLGDSPGVVLRLPYRPPYNWPLMLAFLGRRTIPGVEWVRGDRYGRTFALADGSGWLEVWHDPDQAQLIAEVHTSDVRVIPTVSGRLRRLFDLDTDVGPVEAALAADPLLQNKVQLHPGLRMPGAWDEFELAARAILGQQVSVAAARTLAGRLAAQYGQPLAAGAAAPPPQHGAAPAEGDLPGSGVLRTFPTPAALAGTDLTTIGLPQARARALSGLAAAVVADPELLSPYQNPRQAVARLVQLPGIGPWTAEYIAMRALRDADAFPASDLGLLQGAAADGSPRPTPVQLTQRAESWRPWRAYAAIHLWTMPAAGGKR